MIDSRTTFLSAATAFTDQVARIPPDRLTGRGLGDWDLRALVGHTSRSLVTVETYLDQPATDVDVPSAADYYLAIAAAGGASGPEIVERGRQAGLALGDDPAAFVADLATGCARSSPARRDLRAHHDRRRDAARRSTCGPAPSSWSCTGSTSSGACGVDPAFEQDAARSTPPPSPPRSPR